MHAAGGGAGTYGRTRSHAAPPLRSAPVSEGSGPVVVRVRTDTGGRRMHLALTEEQQELQDRLRTYFAGLVRRRGARRRPRALLHPADPPHGRGRVAGPGLAGGVRGPGPRAHRPDDLRRGVPLGRRAAPSAHPQQRRADLDVVGHRGAEGAPASRDPAGRGPLLHRLHRAHRRNRSGLAADPRRTGRRRVRHHRREALHQRHPVRRLRVVGGPNRSRTPRSTRGSRCSSSPPTRRASTGLRCAPWPASSPAPPSTTRCGCRRPTWSERRTRDGS